MSHVVSELVAQIEQLTPGDQCQLLRHLLDRIGAPTNPAWEDAWAEELAQRQQDIDAGRVQPLAGPEALQRLLEERS